MLKVFTFFYKNDKIYFHKNQDNTDVIVSIYNQNIESICMYKNLFLYDKNPINSENFYKSINPNIKYTHLKNVGRCEHSYLYHIIKNYDNLAELNIFTCGSSFLKDRYFKRTMFNLFVLLSNKTNNTVFFRNPYPVLYMFDNFKLTHHKTFSIENNIFDDCHVLQQYNGTYTDWYLKNFKNHNINYGSFGGTLAIHKKDILQHPKSYYENLISYIDHHNSPEVSHYFERAWGAVFDPIDENCIFNYSDVRNLHI